MLLLATINSGGISHFYGGEEHKEPVPITPIDVLTRYSILPIQV